MPELCRVYRATVHLAAIRFHRRFTLPADPAHGRPRPLRVTYADSDYRPNRRAEWAAAPATRGRDARTTAGGIDEEAGNDNDDENEDDGTGPTALFIGGIFGSRYLLTGAVDALARKHRIRVLCIDKFGLGGTSAVALSDRIQGWLGTFAPRFRAPRALAGRLER